MFLSWLDNPTIAGAISPSGRYLARAMARHVDPHSADPVIELGPGTGVITEALLERGIARERLCLVEYDPGFCELLRQRFPGVRIVRGDAYRLVDCLGPVLDARPAAIVSSLPLLMKPEPARLGLLTEAFDLLASDGRFIQFTYGPASPIPLGGRTGPTFHAESSAPVWLNLPPARVWVYRRRTSGDSRPARRPQDFLASLRLGTAKIQLGPRKDGESADARHRLAQAQHRHSSKGLDLEPALRILRNLPDLAKPRRPL